MRLLPNAEFRGDFPDDAVWDGEEIVTVGGRNVAQAIAGIMEPLGFAISELEPDAEHWAWQFWATNGRQRIWCSACTLDSCEVYWSAEDWTPIWRSKHRTAYADFLCKLHLALSEDRRFSAVRWFPRAARQPDTQGASSPAS